MRVPDLLGARNLGMGVAGNETHSQGMDAVGLKGEGGAGHEVPGQLMLEAVAPEPVMRSRKALREGIPGTIFRNLGSLFEPFFNCLFHKNSWKKSLTKPRGN